MTALRRTWKLWARRATQAAFLGLWIALFWVTAHPDAALVRPDLFLATDPLAAAVAMAAARVVVPVMLGGLLLIGLTVLWGRFFCGWVCPMGTLLDMVGAIWPDKRHNSLKNDAAWRRVKYYLLAAIAVASVAGSQILYPFDPLVLLFRAVAEGVTPTSGEVVFLPLLPLLVVLGLSAVVPRFWCRYLCPLGALYAAVARFSVVRRRVDGCTGCKGLEERQCITVCSMGLSGTGKSDPSECTRCMSCETSCSTEAVAFPIAVPLPAAREFDPGLQRRTFLVSLAAGTAVGLGVRHSAIASRQVVRPPMVVDEVAFEALCLRCGQCVRSCPSGTLQPLLLEGGFSSLWTPALHPRIGGCQEDCNACAVACPTDAIPAFGPQREEKWAVKMGHVSFHPDRCIINGVHVRKGCLKCVEVCPNEAIEIDHSGKFPRPIAVSYERCVGCGLCDTACRKVVFGESALTLSSHGRGLPVAVVNRPDEPTRGKE